MISLTRPSSVLLMDCKCLAEIVIGGFVEIVIGCLVEIVIGSLAEIAETADNICERKISALSALSARKKTLSARKKNGNFCDICAICEKKNRYPREKE